MRKLLPILLLLISSAALAESGSYRVEVIIFRNLAVISDAIEVDELRSFSRYPALEETDLPDDLSVLTEKSTSMDNVWRRLRSSQNYRPLLFSAWEQNRTDYYPPMRIHDEIVIDTEIRSPTNIMIADLNAEDPLAAYRSTFYRLDGSVQLRRSRFLHVYLDLEYREQTAAIEPQADLQTTTQATFFDNQGKLTPVEEEQLSQNIHRLKQNRQVRSSTMQYFDAPYFGALVLVTPISESQN
jgi:hypothetical protein